MQAIPQPPQFRGSSVESTQRAPHRVRIPHDPSAGVGASTGAIASIIAAASMGATVTGALHTPLAHVPELAQSALLLQATRHVPSDPQTRSAPHSVLTAQSAGCPGGTQTFFAICPDPEHRQPSVQSRSVRHCARQKPPAHTKGSAQSPLNMHCRASDCRTAHPEALKTNSPTKTIRNAVHVAAYRARPTRRNAAAHPSSPNRCSLFAWCIPSRYTHRARRSEQNARAQRSGRSLESMSHARASNVRDGSPRVSRGIFATTVFA